MQLRAKPGTMSDRALYDLAMAISAACKERHVPFVINDRADLAVLVGAAGLHIGQDDIPMGRARELLPGKCIGLSTHNLDQAVAAEASGADLIGFGPVFDTSSKKNPDPTVGVAGLRQAAHAVKIPVVAIGGVTHENAKELFAAGAQFVAAISALAPVGGSPKEAARRLHACSFPVRR